MLESENSLSSFSIESTNPRRSATRAASSFDNMNASPTDRATRYRGEGRPKRRLSPSPPPPKIPAPKSPSTVKKSTSKAKDTGSSSTKTSAPKKKPRTPTPEEEPEEESLRSEFRPGQPFPTLKEPQPEDLPLRSYKSVKESAVLSTALEKSRQRWLADGLFEKFWVKYSRKNKDESAATNQSMTKLNGDCTMIIEPHSFKITLFSVKAPPSSLAKTSPAPAAAATAIQTQMHAPSVPRSSNAHATGSHAPPAAPKMKPWTPPLPQNSPNIQTTQAESKSLPADRLATAESQPTQSRKTAPLPSSSDAVKENESQPGIGSPIAAAPPADQASRQDTANNTDPVIQMLAARAATDQELKSLMKIVAQGQATQEQLGVFQQHIDDLNGIIQAQKRQTTNNSDAATTFPASQPRPPAPLPAPPKQFTTYPVQQSGLNSAAIKHEPFATFYNPSSAPLSKQKVPSLTKPVLSAIVFEFNESSGTRYLLPKNSILEFLPGNKQLLMSFLIIRKGDAAIGRKYRQQKEYYQPLTIRLIADTPKLLEPLVRVVNPRDEVYKYMVDTMNSLDLAEKVHLATRLPRPDEDVAEADVSKETKSNDELKSHYPPPDSLFPFYGQINPISLE